MCRLRPMILLASAITISMCMTNTANAAGKIKPGLWEMTIQSDAMKNMPKIPPEQLEQLKKMGIKLPTMQNGGITQQVCITKEMAEREQPPMTSKDQSVCKPQNIQQSGMSYSMDMVCDSPEIKGIGKVKGSYTNADSMHSAYDFKGTSHDRPITQHVETDGKWLSAVCGDVKPIGDVAPKK